MTFLFDTSLSPATVVPGSGKVMFSQACVIPFVRRGVYSSGSSGRVRGGWETWNLCGRLWRPSFYDLFSQGRGGHGPLGSPLDPLLVYSSIQWGGGVWPGVSAQSGLPRKIYHTPWADTSNPRPPPKTATEAGSTHSHWNAFLFDIVFEVALLF